MTWGNKMKIDLENLREQFGLYVKIKNDYLYFESFNWDDEIREALRKIGEMQGWNDGEIDQLFSAAYRIAIMSALRRCSNW
jgi:hypothetical protein